MYLAVIMAGGAGERFWPYSRRQFPKQLLTLGSDKPLLVETIDRINALIPPEKIFIVAGEHLQKAILQLLPHFPAQNIIIEPMPRNTAPCLALAVAVTASLFTDPTLIVLTADHYVSRQEKFLLNLQAALRYAEANPVLVTFGIPPRHPDTGFGYLEAGEIIADTEFGRLRRVVKFHEKPDQHTAEAYMRTGNFYWNSGMFCWRTSTFLTTAQRYAPELATSVSDIQSALGKPQQAEILRQVFESLPKTSIDYALMEKAHNVVMVEAEFGWDDIGSWAALERITEKQNGSNVIVGKCLLEDTRDSVVFNKPIFNVSEREPLIATLGVSDLIIVNVGDVVLVCHKDRCQEIRQLIEALRQKNWVEYL